MILKWIDISDRLSYLHVGDNFEVCIERQSSGYPKGWYMRCDEMKISNLNISPLDKTLEEAKEIVLEAVEDNLTGHIEEYERIRSVIHSNRRV